MIKKYVSSLWIILAVMAMLAVPASANEVQSASATANCQGYSLSVVVVGLGKGQTYTVNYNFAVTCNGGSTVNYPGTITFVATAHTQTVTASGTFGSGLVGSCSVTGTAVLVDKKEYPKNIIINGVKVAPLSCSIPVVNCVNIVADQGVPITPVQLTASGGAGAPYTFSATGLPPGLTISPSGLISGTPTASGTFPYTVTVTDSAGNKGTSNCTVTVNPPPQMTCSLVSMGEVGVPFNSGPPTVTGGTPPYTFSVGSGTIPPGLTLNTMTGAVTGTPTAPGTFTIKVTDSLGDTASQGCTITIVGPPQINCSATNSQGEVGVPFNSGTITVTGGTPPYTYSIVGTLPAGLTFNASTGVVSGTPTAAGSFSIQATDADGVSAGSCPFTIVGAPQINCSATNSQGEVGAPFNSGPITVTGGTPPYTFAVVGTLPAGLTFNASTGVVSGTPTAAGSFSIQATDSKGVVAGSCPFTIIGPPQINCSATNSQGEVGAPFNSGPITVTGGTPPYTFTVVGTLPAGLTFNASTGVVSGTPTAAGSFSIQATDAKGVVAGSCPFTIIPGPQVSCSATNSTGEVGVAFNSGTITVTGGTPPYTYSIVGTLPAGLTFNASTGVVSGTPTAAGSFSIQVTDALGVVAGSCPFTINPALTVTCYATNVGTVGVPFDSGPMTVTGGTPPYTFSVGSGTLPPGLTLNPTNGDVSGTPTAPGTFTIIVTDSVGNVGTGCTITINSAVCLASQFGAASGFSVLGLQGANLNFSSGGTMVTGNVGVGVNGQLNFSGGGTVYGTLYADPTAQIQLSGGSQFTGGEHTQSMAAIQSAAAAEATTLNGLTPTQTFGSITSSTTFTGNGGQNVIQINGQVNLGGASTLTIVGGPNDTFVFDISNQFQLSGGSNIVLNGVSPNQVIWYLPGNGNQVQTTGNSNTAGIFFVPSGQIQISGGVHVSEFIAGQGITLHSAPVVKAFPACGPGQLALTCPASTGVVNEPYNSALVATGGEPPYTFSITMGALPPVLTLAPSTGDITGTPTTAGTFNFTAQVVDSSGQAAGTVSQNCSINVTTTQYVCVIPPSGTAIGGSGTSWNKFTATSGDVVWINMHIGTPSGVPTNTVTTVQFTGMNFVLNGVKYGLPDGFLIFDPSAPATPTTTYNSAYSPNGAWTTTINPSDLSDEIFFDGQAVPVDSNITSGGQANLTYTTESTDNALSFSWQWSAAVYTYWPDNNTANILPYHAGGLHAGTPQNTQVQQSLIQGPRGGGGSNFTGSWSATGNGACPGATHAPHLLGGNN